MKKLLLSALFIAAGFPVAVFADLPDSIRNGSDFYIVFMDEASETSLGGKVKQPIMLRSIQIWPYPELTLEANNSSSPNAWGTAADYLALKVAEVAKVRGWNGGAIVADINEFDKIPNLTDITNNPRDYYFHFAIKSPDTQSQVGWYLFLYSDGTPATGKAGDGVTYYVGPPGSVSAGAINLGNYNHDGKWQHFEIPVLDLVANNYQWYTELKGWGNDTVPLVGFQNPQNIVGAELNLDAVFFYRKPASGNRINPNPADIENALSVYPNPAAHTLRIRGIDGSVVAVRIFDLTGKTVLSRTLSEGEIDIAGLSRGVYFLRVKNRTVKFIKK
jgi:hypothetical protein